MQEPKNQMLGTMEPPLMQLSVNFFFFFFDGMCAPDPEPLVKVV